MGYAGRNFDLDDPANWTDSKAPLAGAAREEASLPKALKGLELPNLDNL